MKTLGLRHALILSALLALFLSSCGHHGSSSTPSGAGLPGSRAQAGPRTVLLSNVLRDIDAYPVPKGVSAQTWSMLVTELKKQLIARSKDGKTLSIAPTGSGNAVSDLAAVSDAGGTQATVTWTEKLAGDCNNDGEVSIADLQPIALHYGETSTGPGSAAYLADANGDGEVGITDLQPIAADYSMHIEGYEVWRGAFNGTTTTWEGTIRPNSNVANPNWSADRTTSPPAMDRPAYIYLDDISGLTDKTNVRFKVAPYGDSEAGVESNEAVMPPPGAPTYSVSGTVTEGGVGLAGVTMTLVPGGLNATTQADGTYAIPGVADGTYTLTPLKTGFVFAPATRSVNVSGADVTGQDFTGQAGLATTAWPKFHQNQFNTGQSPYNGAQSNSLKWSFTTGAWVLSSPSLAADGTIYFGSWDNSFYALNPDGTTKWTHAFANHVSDSAAIGLDGTLYFGGLDGYMYALSPVDGSVIWSYNVISSIGSAGTTIGPDGTVYLGNGGYQLQAFRPSDGSLKWASDLHGQISACPAIAIDGTIYEGSGDGNLYALNPLDGSVKWTHMTTATIGVSNSPAIGADGTIYVAADDHKIYALNPSDGSEKWAYTSPDPYGYTAPVVAADGTIYVSQALKFIALNPADGSLKWSIAPPDAFQSSPAIGADGKIYIGCNDNKLYCLSPTDGSVVWEYATGDHVFSSPSIGADGTTYVGSNDGKLYAFGAGGSPATWAVKGRVSYIGAPLAGVTVTVTPGMQSAVTDSYGNYEIKGIPDGDYSLDPSKPGYVFAPPSRPITVSGGNLINQNFSAVIGPANSAWPKFHHDYFNSGQSDLVGPQTNALVWQKVLSAQSVSSPAIAADGTVYVGCDTGQVHAFAPDGTQKWLSNLGGIISTGLAVGADGTVYVGTENGNLYALEPIGGTTNWTFPTGGPIAFPGGPSVGPDGTIYIGSCDKNVYALDPTTGTQKWQYTTGGEVHSCPAVGSDGTIYVGSTDKKVYALNPIDGSLKWAHPTGGMVYSSPSVGWDGRIFVTTWDDHKALALSPADGSEIWSFATTMSNIDGSPAWSSDGTVYIGGTDGIVYALSGLDGTQKWRYPTSGSAGGMESSPAIGADGTVYVGTNSGVIHALNPDGTLKWDYTTVTLGALSASPALTTNRLYIPSRDVSLYAIGS